MTNIQTAIILFLIISQGFIDLAITYRLIKRIRNLEASLTQRAALYEFGDLDKLRDGTLQESLEARFTPTP